MKPNRLLTTFLAIAFLAGASLLVTPPALSVIPTDQFDKANQVQVDPFSEINKAPPIDWGKVGAEAGKKFEGPEPKDPPATVKKPSDAIDFEVTVSPTTCPRQGDFVRITVTGIPRKGWYTYSMTQRTPDQGGPAVSTFVMIPVEGLQPLVPIQESAFQLEVEPKLGAYFRHRSKFTWSFDVLVKPDAKLGSTAFPFAVKLQVCDKSTCVPGEVQFKPVLDIFPGEKPVVPAGILERANQKFPPESVEVVSEGPNNQAKVKPLIQAPPTSAANFAGIALDHAASIGRVDKQFQPAKFKAAEGLGAFVLAGMFWGFVSLITPCVFPMIPITVSFFLKQSEKEHHKPVTMAVVYCVTIVVVLTIAATALLSFFRMLSINPFMNFGLGVLFVVFALSLFGMFDIELPSFLARYTSERESKGGMLGTVFMALTFTIISFACVAPFLGGFGGTAATTIRPFWHTILGGLAFAVTFAAPFFILALFPALLKALPKSGSWLNSVKVVMGFLELAAAFKFFRGAELLLFSSATVFTFDLVLGLWVAISLVCGLYLLGVFRLPLDSPLEHLSVPRLLLSCAFLALVLYLSAGLFVRVEPGEQSRPSGSVFAWVSAFLLPDARPAKGEVWTGNLEHAIAQAREYRRTTGKPKLVFIDFTGVYCTNCNLNENDVFVKPEIQALFKPYELVKLYTDKVPIQLYAPEDRQSVSASRQDGDAAVNARFQKKVFDTEQLPLYVILEPQLDNTIKIVGTYDEGRIMNHAAFAAFLRQPQEGIGAVVASR